MMARWRAPTIVCTRTELGTINHSLLTIEALRARGVPVIGIAFIGKAHDENERIIPKLAGVSSLGRLPVLKQLDEASSAERRVGKSVAVRVDLGGRRII